MLAIAVNAVFQSRDLRLLRCQSGSLRKLGAVKDTFDSFDGDIGDKIFGSNDGSSSLYRTT